MNRCEYQQRSAATAAMATCEVACPKPRRFGPFVHTSINEDFRLPFRCHIQSSYIAENSESDAGTELIEMILTKGNNRAEKSNSNMGSSPPFFYGSPPSRAPNPLIQDAQFSSHQAPPPSLGAGTTFATSPSASARCARMMQFGHKPAAVRIEGFDCLGQDRRSRSISAMA